MVLYTVDPSASQPLFEQLAAGIRAAIIAGTLAPGERLLAARELADSLDINLHTVLRAYQQLRDEGFLDLRRGRGAVVTERAHDYAELGARVRAVADEAQRLDLTPGALSALIRRPTCECPRNPPPQPAVGVILPAAQLIVAIAVMLWALPDLPNPVAVHWGRPGSPTASARRPSRWCCSPSSGWGT